LGVFAATIALTRTVSLGSILAALLFPAFLAVFGVPGGVIAASVPILALILIRHAGNIARIIHGTERKLGAKEAKNA
jgi:glycerol-3-phosphate acyltransferase PlsY